MPGLPLRGAWTDEPAPRLLYCSAGPPGDDAGAVETTAPGCDSAMCYAARREAANAEGAGRRWAVGPPRTAGPSSDRWRVACLRADRELVVALVADERFGQRQLRAFAERARARAERTSPRNSPKCPRGVRADRGDAAGRDVDIPRGQLERTKIDGRRR